MTHAKNHRPVSRYLLQTASALSLTVFLSACASNQTQDVSAVEQTAEPVAEDTTVTEVEPVAADPVPSVNEQDNTFTPPPEPRDRVEFAFDSSEISKAEKQDLTRWAEYINQLMINRVEVHGHADDTGDESYNRELSARRAYSAAELLRSMVDHHIDITEVAHGEREPIADNDSVEGRAQNRRVEVIIPEDTQLGMKQQSSLEQGTAPSEG